MSAILLNSGIVDLVVGGCGTGIGYMNSVMQYPGIACGLIHSPLDAWLFAQINDGNCISLALNQGYGWASNINLRFIFDQYFGVEHGKGYPDHRREPQSVSRELLKTISTITHRSMVEIIDYLPHHVMDTVVKYPGFIDFVLESGFENSDILKSLQKRS
jgi:hypothetical protein